MEKKNGMHKINIALLILVLAALWSCSSDADVVAPDTGSEDNPNAGVDTLYYLALGDSYTIGTAVEMEDRFPVQLTTRLNAAHQDSIFLSAPDFIAKAGWTSSDLLEAAEKAQELNRPYDLVTLLIGVNNQYQQLPSEVFERDLEDLLQFGIEAAAGDTSRLVLVSVPDYAYTPFGQNAGDPARVSAEIEKYNGYLEEQAREYGISFVNVTPLSRAGLYDSTLLAEDGLHPSGKMYAGWVNLLFRDAEKALSLK